ncbi:MAG: 50S ribosomal protein L33 [Candidatus Omnitrophica bacterium]|nr:50S ribosomal protein L33 [Candidatus Omnitrophota bacterium]
MVQEIITLECTTCKNRNYTSTKNKKNVAERLQRKKHCRFCRTHTVHKEIR